MASTFDATTNAKAGVVSSLSWTHTPTGTPSGVGVGVAWWDGANAVSTATYGGTSMTPHKISDINGSSDRVSIFALANPSSGSQTVAIGWGTSVVPNGVAITVTGGDTTTVHSNTSSANGSSTAPSTTCTSATGELVMDFGAHRWPTDMTAGADQTERADFLNNSGDTEIFSSTESGATSVTMSWSNGTSANWAIAAMAFKSDGTVPVVPSLRVITTGLQW